MARQNLTPVTAQQLADVEELLKRMKERANESINTKDPYMASIYAELVKVVSPIVTRAYTRKHREEKAIINAGVKQLRKSQTPFEAKDQQSQASSEQS